MSTAAVIEYPEIDQLVLESDLPVENPETGFMIDTQEKATWTARKIIQAENRINERSQLAKSCKSRIDGWLAEANRRDEASIESLLSLLTLYLRDELGGSTKRRSIDLLGAKLGFRKLPERVEIIDPEKAITYCETNHPEALIIKKELSRTELRRIALKGELVPGVVLDGGADKLYVKSAEVV